MLSTDRSRRRPCHPTAGGGPTTLTRLMPQRSHAVLAPVPDVLYRAQLRRQRQHLPVQPLRPSRRRDRGKPGTERPRRLTGINYSLYAVHAMNQSRYGVLVSLLLLLLLTGGFFFAARVALTAVNNSVQKAIATATVVV